MKEKKLHPRGASQLAMYTFTALATLQKIPYQLV